MKEYKVLIEETVSGEFKVLANNEEEAVRIAKSKYDKGEFVNEPGELIDVAIEVKY